MHMIAYVDSVWPKIGGFSHGFEKNGDYLTLDQMPGDVVQAGGQDLTDFGLSTLESVNFANPNWLECLGPGKVWDPPA